MRNWLMTYSAYIVIASMTTVFGQAKTATDGAKSKPKEKDEPVKQSVWLELKKKVETEVAKEVEKAFKDRILFIKGFKDRVYKVGTRVKVTRIIGRARPVEGLFQEVKVIGKDTVKVTGGKLFDTKNFYAVISNTRYRLNDLDKESALRLLYGALPVEGENNAIKEANRALAVQNYIDSELAKVRRVMNIRIEQMKNERFSKAKFNEMFFAKNVLINGYYYSPAHLGLDKLILKVEIPKSPRVPCAEFKLQVRCPFKGIVVFRLGDKVISSSTLDYTNPANADLEKYILSGYISKKDLGSKPALMIAKAEVQFICDKIDAKWVAQARGTTHSKNGLQSRTELIGFSMDKSTFGKVTSTIKVDLKSSVWNAKDYQDKRVKEMAALANKSTVQPAKKTPAAK